VNDGSRQGAAGAATFHFLDDQQQVQHAFDLSHARLELALVTPTVASSNQIFFALVQGSDGTQIGWNSNNAEMFTVQPVQQVFIDAGPIDPVAMRRLRLTVDDGELVYETSPDGMAWTERGRIAVPGGFDVSDINIGATNLGLAPADNAVRIDDVTIVPVCRP
jgi:hypothetical protein